MDHNLLNEYRSDTKSNTDINLDLIFQRLFAHLVELKSVQNCFQSGPERVLNEGSDSKLEQIQVEIHCLDSGSLKTWALWRLWGRETGRGHMSSHA